VFLSEAAVLVAAVLPVCAALSFYRSVSSAPLDDPYKMELLTTRLAGARQMTPEDATLGFITDIPEQNESVFQTLYYGAQYGLAPRLLERGTNHHYVLGVFTNELTVRPAMERDQLRLVKYFGKGVVLLQNEAR